MRLRTEENPPSGTGKFPGPNPVQSLKETASSSAAQPVSDNWKPDMMIGIDFGSIGTAVAWQNLDGAEPAGLQLITTWPGKDGQVFATKAPSRVSYNKGKTSVKAWGFQSNYDDTAEDVIKGFKNRLDPDLYNPLHWKGLLPGEISVDDAFRYARDFLSCLYRYVSMTISDQCPGFSLRKVEWAFTIPYALFKPSIRDRMQDLIKEAGFSTSYYHRSTLVVSEASAAIESVRDRIPGDDYGILLCHAGGDALNVSIMQTLVRDDKSKESEVIAWSDNKPIGPAKLDQELHEKIMDRLRASQLPELKLDDAKLESMTRAMLSGNYRTYKHSLGTTTASSPHFYLLQIKILGLSNTASDPAASIRDGLMEFSEKEIASLFDEQINALVPVVKSRIEKAKHIFKNRSLILVMSGGFSNNKYLQTRLDQAFLDYDVLASDQGLVSQIVYPEDGVLSVVTGLVRCRINELNRPVTRLNLQEQRIGLASRNIKMFEATYQRRTVSQQTEQLSAILDELLGSIATAKGLQAESRRTLDPQEQAYIEKAVLEAGLLEAEVKEILADLEPSKRWTPSPAAATKRIGFGTFLASSRRQRSNSQEEDKEEEQLVNGDVEPEAIRLARRTTSSKKKRSSSGFSYQEKSSSISTPIDSRRKLAARLPNLSMAVQQLDFVLDFLIKKVQRSRTPYPPPPIAPRLSLSADSAQAPSYSGSIHESTYSYSGPNGFITSAAPSAVPTRASSIISTETRVSLATTIGTMQTQSQPQSQAQSQSQRPILHAGVPAPTGDGPPEMSQLHLQYELRRGLMQHPVDSTRSFDIHEEMPPTYREAIGAT